MKEVGWVGGGYIRACGLFNKKNINSFTTLLIVELIVLSNFVEEEPEFVRVDIFFVVDLSVIVINVIVH